MGSLHGYEIDCDREMGRLSEARGELGSIRVRAAESSLLERRGRLLHYVESRAGGPLAGIARTDGGLLAWLVDAGSFTIDAPALTVSYRREDAGRAEGDLRWGDRLGSTVVPLLAAERGALALHASGNLVADRALLICGVTGRGKSTLTAALAASGHPLLAEDGVVVHSREGVPTVWPGMSGALVTDEARETIRGAPAGEREGRDHRGRTLLEVQAAQQPARLGAVAILAERRGERVEVERLSPAKAHRELLAQVLRGGRVGADHFASAARLAEAAAIFLVRIPDRIEVLPEAARELASAVGFE